MSRKPYPAYKASGIAWLGNVPEGWDVERLKFLATSRVSNVDKLSGEDEIPVRLCNYVDVYKNDEITPELSFMEATATPEEIVKFGLKVGDVLITKDSEDWRDIAIPAYVRETADDLVCGYHLAIVRASERRLDARYLFDLFRSRSVNTQFQIASSGVTRYGLPKSAVGEAWVPIPPKVEQEKISAFIGIQSRRIDELIAKKRELIERLKEKRTALISHVVTKGLPPEEAAQHGLPVNPPLKPSGVPWLGEVPIGWTLRRMKYQIASTKNGVWGEEPTGEDDLLCVRVADFDRESRSVHLKSPTYRSISISERKGRLLRFGDLLIEKSGGGDNQPVGTVVRYTLLDEAVCSNFVARVVPRQDQDGRYLCYLHRSLYEARWNTRSIKQNTGIQNLDSDAYFNDIAPNPPREEQRQIADFLDRETAKIEELIAKKRELIEKLQEYRSALITAAVTGKIDVREEASA